MLNKKRSLRTALLTTTFVAGALAGPGDARAAGEVETVTSRLFNMLCPSKIGAGDNEFHGHGPLTTTDVSLIRQGGEVGLRVGYHVKETVSDWTEARLDTFITLADARNYDAFWGLNSAGVWAWLPFPDGPLPIASWNDQYTDTDHFPRSVTRTGHHWLEEVIMNGDNKGTDIGSCGVNKSYVSVRTADIFFRVR